MYHLIFEHNPDIDKLGKAFPNSPYFSEETVRHKIGTRGYKSGIIVAYVGNSIAGALSWENDGRLKIGQVEVHSHHRGNGIGSELIREGERVNKGVHQAIGYLNDRRNGSSARMFGRAGYTRKDELKFYKTL